jgi:hypothetical protein
VGENKIFQSRLWCSKAADRSSEKQLKFSGFFGTDGVMIELVLIFALATPIVHSYSWHTFTQSSEKKKKNLESEVTVR